MMCVPLHPSRFLVQCQRQCSAHPACLACLADASHTVSRGFTLYSVPSSSTFAHSAACSVARPEHAASTVLQCIAMPLRFPDKSAHTEARRSASEVKSCMQVEGVARLCAATDVPHIINNAYGIQSAQICARVTRACRVGRVDAIIQSTDKNFMVPVGGAVLTAPTNRPQLVEAVSSAYPGRASASAHIDLAITLLHWGRSGWLKALAEREALFTYMQVWPWDVNISQSVSQDVRCIGPYWRS
jgi:hypothetical protein